MRGVLLNARGTYKGRVPRRYADTLSGVYETIRGVIYHC